MAHDDLWDVYAGAVIECVVDGVTLRLDGPSLDSLPGVAPLFVLTAYNPQGLVRASAENDAAQADLEQELAGSGLTYWPALGRSPDASWSEPGVAVAGLDRGSACALGDRYGQLAVYEIVAEEVRVVRCVNGEVVRARPRVR